MYLPDPKDGKPSVSLTMLGISFVTVLGFSISSVLEYTKEPGPLMELFYATAALYFGRRVSIGGKLFSGKEKGTQSE
jgi:hypothetical protein